MLVNAKDAPIESLQSALAYLMTRYSSIISLNLSECPACCALTIVGQLKAILAHPEIQSSHSLKDTYLQLLRNWELLGEHDEKNHPRNQEFMTEENKSGVVH